MKRLVSWSAGLAGCVLASAVHAATVSASVSGLVFTLTDLDPDDGVAPSISWVTGLTQAYASSQSGMVVVWDDQSQGLWHPEFSQAHPDAFELDDTSPFIALVATSGGAQAVSSDVAVSAAQVVPIQGGSGFANASIYWGFELSPMTTLSLVGRFDVLIQAPDGATAALPVGSNPAVAMPFAVMSAFADVGIDVSSSPLGSWSDFEAMDLSNHTVSADPLAPATGALSYVLGRSFAYELVNDGGAPMVGTFRAMASVSGSQLAAVPEPATIGMVLAGLLVCGWQVRRRGAWRA